MLGSWIMEYGLFNLSPFITPSMKILVIIQNQCGSSVSGQSAPRIYSTGVAPVPAPIVYVTSTLWHVCQVSAAVTALWLWVFFVSASVWLSSTFNVLIGVQTSPGSGFRIVNMYAICFALFKRVIVIFPDWSSCRIKWSRRPMNFILFAVGLVHILHRCLIIYLGTSGIL